MAQVPLNAFDICFGARVPSILMNVPCALAKTVPTAVVGWEVL